MAINFKRIIGILAAIQEFGNITHAANHLFITQPALSRTLKDEETRLNVMLVDRTSKPLRLTYAGEEYLRGLQTVEDATNKLNTKMSEFSQSKTGNLSIGLSENISTLLLPKLVALYAKNYPNYHLNINELTSKQAASAVIDNQLDLYIGPKPLKKGHFTYRKIQETHYNLFCPSNFAIPFSKIEVNSQLQPFEAKKFIGIDAISITSEIINQFLNNIGLKINPWLQLRNYQTILQVVESGLAFTILPDSFHAYSDKIMVLPISPQLLKSELIIAHRTSKANSPEMIDLLKIMKPLFGIDPEKQQVLQDDL